MLFVARVDGVIAGCLTLAVFRLPTGLRAWIEDVVVDDAARGHGVGAALNLAAIAVAARARRPHASTSRPGRRAKRPTGCTSASDSWPRDTNVYRYGG